MRHGLCGIVKILLLISASGFGTGVALSALFISLQASVQAKYMSPAVSTFYLSSSIGSIAGLASTTAVAQEILRRTLESRLFSLGLDAAERTHVRVTTV